MYGYSLYFYPRSPCGERPTAAEFVGIAGCISIHVPLAGNVPYIRLKLSYSITFLSTFPLRGTSRHVLHACHGGSEFLSTFPLRGTSQARPPGRPRGGISIHVPLAGNVQGGSFKWAVECLISIHVPLAGNVAFGERYALTGYISIHVPLAGNVSLFALTATQSQNFYPRSPCGERPMLLLISSGRASISIHVPLAGNVGYARGSCSPGSNFYPRSPCGERPPG